MATGSATHVRTPLAHTISAEAPPVEIWEFKNDATTVVSTTGSDITWSGIKRSVAASCCSLSAWRDLLPCTYWLPKYSLIDFRGDLVAGLTVGMTVVPQALANAAIAELPLEMGLNASFMGCFMYAILGTARHLALGTTSVLSLMTAAAYPDGASSTDKVYYAILLSFFTGIIQIVLGVCHLGFLVNFFSAPVISGFTSASAFIILIGQLKTLLGFNYRGKGSDTVIDQAIGYIRHANEISGWDTLMGIVCLTLLLLMKNLKLSRHPKFGLGNRTWYILKELVWTVVVTRYVIVIILATAVGYYISILRLTNYVALTNNVKPGIPSFAPPSFTWNNRTVSNTLGAIGPSIPMVVLVAALEAVAVAKTFSFRFQYRINPSQELIALGMSNLLCSFFKGFPVTGSFARSAVKAQTGVRTPMACAWTGAFVLFAMAVISQAFKYIPKAALSAVIVAAVLTLFEFKIFKDLWLVSKQELLVMAVTFIISFVVGVDAGILSGVGVSLVLLLIPIARPLIIAEFKETTYTQNLKTLPSEKRDVCVTVTPQGALFFPSAEYLKDFFHDVVLLEKESVIVPDLKNRKQSGPLVPLQLTSKDVRELENKEANLVQAEQQRYTTIVVNGENLCSSDYTTLRTLRSIVMNCIKINKNISFVNTSASVLEIVLPKEMRAKVPVPTEDYKRTIRTQEMPTPLHSEVDFLVMDPDDVTQDLDQSANDNDGESDKDSGLKIA